MASLQFSFCVTAHTGVANVVLPPVYLTVGLIQEALAIQYHEGNGMNTIYIT